MNLNAVILAAGKSTRMNSQRVKVLHEVCGRPMLAYVLDAVRAVGATRICVVVGHDRQRVMTEFADQNDIQWVHQEQQKGTGHAVQVCRVALSPLSGDTLVLAGDGPLIRAQTLQELIARHHQAGAGATLATSELTNPSGYGRIVRGSGGEFLAIVEEKDATPDQRAIREVNPSYYLFNTTDLFEALGKVTPNNRKGEYYLTDAVSILRLMGRVVQAVSAVPEEDVLSINTRQELARVCGVMQQRIVAEVMGSGVTVVNPQQTWIEFGAKIGQDTVLEPFTFVGCGAVIPPGSHVPAGTVVPRGCVFDANHSARA